MPRGVWCESLLPFFSLALIKLFFLSLIANLDYPLREMWANYLGKSVVSLGFYTTFAVGKESFLSSVG